MGVQNDPEDLNITDADFLKMTADEIVNSIVESEMSRTDGTQGAVSGSAAAGSGTAGGASDTPDKTDTDADCRAPGASAAEKAGGSDNTIRTQDSLPGYKDEDVTAGPGGTDFSEDITDTAGKSVTSGTAVTSDKGGTDYGSVVTTRTEIPVTADVQGSGGSSGEISTVISSEPVKTKSVNGITDGSHISVAAGPDADNNDSDSVAFLEISVDNEGERSKESSEGPEKEPAEATEKEAQVKSGGGKSRDGFSAERDAAVTEDSAHISDDNAYTEGESDVSAATAASDKSSGKRQYEPVNESTRPESGKKRSKALPVFLVLVIGLIAGFGFFIYSGVTSDTFPNGSSINGVDVSGMTLDKAESAVISDYSSNTLVIKESGSEVASFDGKDFDFEIKGGIGGILHPGTKEAVLRIFDKKLRKSEVSLTASPKDEKAFNKAFSSMSVVKNATYTKKTKNAYVDLSTPEFRVVKEVYGNDLDKEKLKNDILTAVSEKNSEFNYIASEYYKQPEIKASGKEIEERLAFCRKYLSHTIKYESGQLSYTLSPADINSMISVNNEKIAVNDAKVKKFVTDVVKPEMNLTGITRTLTSAVGGTYTVSGGTYGKQVNVDKESEKLKSDLLAQKDVTRSPVYSSNGGDDIGPDFVEVDLSAQMCYLVINNKLILSSPVVTGAAVTGHGTPTGVYPIAYKTRNVVLKGRNDDGSKYANHVDYWMPFNGGVGFHDANWRGAFGGGIYYSGGSHGCVNMPPSKAAQLYGYVYAGMPVIVHV